MSITYPEEAVVAALEDDEGVSDAVGARIFAMVPPMDAARPCILMSRSSDKPASMNPDNTSFDVMLSIDSWADTYGAARSLAKHVRRVLIGLTHEDEAYTISPISMVDESDETEPGPSGQEMPVFGVSQTFIMSYTEN